MRDREVFWGYVEIEECRAGRLGQTKVRRVSL
jgi:hypothetical protein